MKKYLKLAVLSSVFACLLCVGALATDGSGMYNVTKETIDGCEITLTPQDADGNAIQPALTTIDGTEQTLYVGAVKATLTVTGATEGKNYLVLALNDDSAAPTTGNIAYINQTTLGSGVTTVTFNIYPSELENGKSYAVYLTSDDTKFTTVTKVASFRYYVPYTLGDVDNDGYWTANDALYALQIAVNKAAVTINNVSTTVSNTMKLASDTDKDGYVTANDALLILQKTVGKNVF